MRGRRDHTPDAHAFPTRPYDLVKEFVVALTVVSVLTVVLAAVFSSPDEKAISLADWARAAPADVEATATAELAGTSTSAGYPSFRRAVPRTKHLSGSPPPTFTYATPLASNDGNPFPLR